MYLHLIHPDVKFVPMVRDLFEAVAPEQNEYVVYNYMAKDFSGVDGVRLVSNADELREFCASRDDWQGVIINGMCESLATTIDVFPPDLKIAWFIWGHELYGIWPSLYGQLYGPWTRRYAAAEWRHVLRPYWWGLTGRYAKMKKVLKRVNYFVSQLPDEFEILKQNEISFGMQYLDCPVAPLECFVDVESGFAKLGVDIQVGNSASYSNNHTEAFLRLSDVDLTGRKVLVPLSYGPAECRRRVIADGERILGEHFEPITEFMNLSKYSKLMQRCGVVIMNHHRQQALGNIIAALWRGAHVMLNDTPVLKRFAAEEFSVHDFNFVNPLDLKPLSVNEQDEQRAKLRRNISTETVYAKARNALRQLSPSS